MARRLLLLLAAFLLILVAVEADITNNSAVSVEEDSPSADLQWWRYVVIPVGAVAGVLLCSGCAIWAKVAQETREG